MSKNEKEAKEKEEALKTRQVGRRLLLHTLRPALIPTYLQQAQARPLSQRELDERHLREMAQNWRQAAKTSPDVHVTRAEQPISQFPDLAGLLVGSFPDFFLLNSGPFISGTGRAIQGCLQPEQHRHILLQFRARAPLELLLLLSNILLRTTGMRKLTAKAKGHPDVLRPFERLMQEPDMPKLLEKGKGNQEAAHKLFDKVQPLISVASAGVPGTGSSKHSVTTNMHAIGLRFGHQTMFLTFAVDDVTNEMVYRLHQPAVGGNMQFPVQPGNLMEQLRRASGPGSQNEELEIRLPDLYQQAPRAAVAVAVSFEVGLRALLEALLGTEPHGKGRGRRMPDSIPVGIFGRVLAYSCSVETTGRGSLHAHLGLVTQLSHRFIAENIHLQSMADELARAMYQWSRAAAGPQLHLDDMLRHLRHDRRPRPSLQVDEVRRQALETDTAYEARLIALGELVRVVLSRHVHTMSCHYGRTGLLWCRMLYMRPLVEPPTRFVQIEPSDDYVEYLKQKKDRRSHHEQVPIKFKVLGQIQPRPRLPPRSKQPLRPSDPRLLMLDTERPRLQPPPELKLVIRQLQQQQQPTDPRFHGISLDELQHLYRVFPLMNGTMVASNDVLLSLLGCNSNAEYLDGDAEAEAASEYAGKYVGKMDTDIRAAVSIYSFAGQLIQAHPSRAHDTVFSPVQRKTLHWLEVIMNRQIALEELASTKAAMVALGYDLERSSHHVILMYGENNTSYAIRLQPKVGAARPAMGIHAQQDEQYARRPNTRRSRKRRRQRPSRRTGSRGPRRRSSRRRRSRSRPPSPSRSRPRATS